MLAMVGITAMVVVVDMQLAMVAAAVGVTTCSSAAWLLISTIQYQVLCCRLHALQQLGFSSGSDIALSTPSSSAAWFLTSWDIVGTLLDFSASRSITLRFVYYLFT